jgi:hypothetical protein
MRKRTLALFAVPLAVAFAPGRASADEKAACVAASEQAQTLRDEGKFSAERAQLMVCSRDACPAIVRKDCDRWLSDLDSMQPTIVLGARDPKGNDAPVTRVLLDGALLTTRLDGKPIPVDPGEHTIRYEATGAAPVEQHAVIRVGEKNRMLTAVVMMAAPTSVAPATAKATPAEPAPSETPSSGAGIPPLTIVFGAVAVAAGASFAYFGLSGQSDASNLRSTCAPNCTQDQVDSVKTKLLVADVSLGVGVASLVAAGYFFFHGRSSPSPTQSGAVSAGFTPAPGGGVATIGARF